MSYYYAPSGERVVNSLPKAVARLEDSDFGATLSLLSQTQAELDASRAQIESLKQRIQELETLSTTDPLTGLKNRYGFEEGFARELDRVKRGKSTGGVLVMIDLDSFKAINDTYGHQAGDACLRLVGHVLANEIRSMDVAARLGGDEFVLLLAETTPELLLTRVQNIAWKLNHLNLIWDGVEISLHASVGMKPYQKDDKAADIFAEADRNMYQNKKRSS